MASSHELRNLLLRLRTLEDRAALTSLLNRYCWQVDLKNWETFGEIQGRDNIVAATIKAEERFEGMQHSMTNREFAVSYKDEDAVNGSVGDIAAGTAYLIFAVAEDTRRHSEHHFKMGRPYHFEFQRIYDPDTEDGNAWGARG